MDKTIEIECQISDCNTVIRSITALRNSSLQVRHSNTLRQNSSYGELFQEALKKVTDFDDYLWKAQYDMEARVRELKRELRNIKKSAVIS